MQSMQTDPIKDKAAELTGALEAAVHRSIRIDAIKPAAHGNPNRMRPDQFEALKESIKRFGFAQPITVRPINDGEAYEIVDGHHRYRALDELNVMFVPCLIVQMTEGEARIAAVALNRIRGELDLVDVGQVFVDVLQGWAGHFDSPGDLAVSGFSVEEVADLMRVATQDSDPTTTALEGGDMDAPDLSTDGQPAPRPFVLEVEFEDAKQFKAVRRALRKAAGGRGKPLALGLIAVLGIETD